jgi:hypothetical protein
VCDTAVEKLQEWDIFTKKDLKLTSTPENFFTSRKREVG